MFVDHLSAHAKSRDAGRFPPAPVQVRRARQRFLEIGPTLANIEPIPADFGQLKAWPFGPRFAPNRVNIDIGKDGSESINSGPMSTDTDQTSKVSPQSTEFGHESTEFGSMLAHVWPMSAEFAPERAISGR